MPIFCVCVLENVFTYQQQQKKEKNSQQMGYRLKTQLAFAYFLLSIHFIPVARSQNRPGRKKGNKFVATN